MDRRDERDRRIRELEERLSRLSEASLRITEDYVFTETRVGFMMPKGEGGWNRGTLPEPEGTYHKI